MLELLHKNSLEIIFVLALIQLMLAVYFDIRYAKFPNKFALIFLIFNLFAVLLLRGPSGLMLSAITMLVAVGFLAPIYLVRMLGGGDIKLFFALSPLLLMGEFIHFLLASIVWAGIFGVVSLLLKKDFLSTVYRSVLLLRKTAVAQGRIPFTVGMLLGWCSYKSFMTLGLLG